MTISLRSTIFASAASIALGTGAAFAQDNANSAEEYTLPPEVMANIQMQKAAEKKADKMEKMIDAIIEMTSERHANNPNLDNAKEIIYKSILEQSASGETDIEKITYTAINEVLKTVDPHSSFIPANDVDDFSAQVQGSFSGIGVHITEDNTQEQREAIQTERSKMYDALKAMDLDNQTIFEQMSEYFKAPKLVRGLKVVEAVSDDSPAAMAGVQSDDLITHVDGVPLAGKTLETSVDLIKGPTNTTVQITVERAGEPLPITLDVIRGTVEQSPVTSKLLENNVGYLHLSTFNKMSDPYIDKAIKELTDQGAEKFILDLRGNSGGLVTAADQIVENFISGDPAFIELSKRHVQAQANVAIAAVKKVFANDDGQGISNVKIGEFFKTLPDHEKRVLYFWFDQNNASMAPHIVQILEDHNKIQSGEFQMPELTDAEQKIIADNTFLSERTVDGKSPQLYVTPGSDTDAPMVVLINSGSASASEIVAGTLQNYGRATIIGNRSFGKGSGQTTMPLDVDQDNELDGILKLTTFFYYVGKGEGYNLQGRGVVPDYTVSEEFEAISTPKTTEASLNNTLQHPSDANYVEIKPRGECKPATVSVEHEGLKVAEYSTKNTEDPALLCALEFLNSDNANNVTIEPITYDEDTAPFYPDAPAPR